MTNIYLRLLAILGELDRTRSVSQAAENLQLTQSAISMSLAKLRKHFNDPLFVKTSNGMEPTPQAIEVIQLLQRAEGLLQLALEHHVVFDAATSGRTFHIHSTGIGQVVLLPRLMELARSIAPFLSFSFQKTSADTPRLLESGGADLAVGFLPSMGAGYCQRALFEEHFVCAVRKDHPRLKSAMTVEQFQAEDHLVVSTDGTAHGILDRTLTECKINRRIRLTVPSFLGIESLIVSTDCLVCLPNMLAQHMARTSNIKVLALPFSMPAYPVSQQWHNRYSQDQGHKWLRDTLANLWHRYHEEPRLGELSPASVSNGRLSRSSNPVQTKASTAPSRDQVTTRNGLKKADFTNSKG